MATLHKTAVDDINGPGRSRNFQIPDILAQPRPGCDVPNRGVECRCRDIDDDENDTMNSLSIQDDSHLPAVQPSSTSTHSPYLHPTHQATPSTSTFNVGGQLAHAGATVSTPTAGHTPIVHGTPHAPASRKPSSLRHSSTAGPAESIAAYIKRRPFSPSVKEGKYSSKSSSRIRATPRLPHSDDAPAPATAMYWSRAPDHGFLPMRAFRAHTVTLVDHMAWLFGGCDKKGCWRDIYCFDTGKLSFFILSCGMLMGDGLQKQWNGRILKLRVTNHHLAAAILPHLWIVKSSFSVVARAQCTTTARTYLTL